MTFVYLYGEEPAEITWDADGVQVVWAVDKEWWAEKIAYRAKQMGER